MRRLVAIGLSLLSLSGVVGAQSISMRVEKQGCSFKIGAGRLWLIPFNNHVVRVVSTPGDSISARQSLSVIERPTVTATKVEIAGGNFVLRMGDVIAKVDAKTGRLTLSARGSTDVLTETPTAARKLTEVTAGGEKAFAIEQRFQLPKDQAFYGLGCNQLPDLNLSGQNLNLVQDNIIDVNPVLVSTGGYGVLWDNASATKIDLGGTRELIPAARLFDRDKKPGGLTATHFNDKDLKTVGSTKTEGPIDFEWKDKFNFAIRWEGYIQTDAAGEYRFGTEADDGTRLWVNGQQLIEDWHDKPVTSAEGKIKLPANSLIPIRLEYYQNGGGAAVKFNWSPPSTKSEMSIRSEVADQIDYYFIAGPELDRVVKGYRELTGPAPMFGKWAYGLWQCKERYQTQQELLDIAEGYRSRKIPLDNLVQDWFYWDPEPWGSHHFDPKRFPDPAAAIKALHDQNIHLMISVWAKFAPGSANYKELDEKGFLYPKATEDARYYDAFNPQAREMYWRQMNDLLFKKGIDAWWLDATEPEIPMDRYREFPTALGPGARVLNAFSLKTTEAVYKGQREATNDKRVFILTRSVFAGQQRNAAATWSGDIQATWDVFRRQVASGLNFCMAGVPYWCTDIGGFFSKPETDPAYGELFTRWFEWGAFNPIFRVHGTGANKELWRFGPEIEKTLVKYDNLRYRLMPYIYSLAWKVTNDDYTLMRGLPMDFRTDANTWNVADQLMFGPAFLVSPVVTEGAKSRNLYLPKPVKWYDFWTGESFTGGQTLRVDAPLDVLPIHVKAGSIVPMGPFIQHTAEKADEPIELRIYPGANGSFRFYEDAGDGYGYEKGELATIPIFWNDKTSTLRLGNREGSFNGMVTSRKFRIVVVGRGHGVGIEETQADAEVDYMGGYIEVKI